MLLGLTGGYCAGKNAAAALLEERGWTCIDVDGLGHEAIDQAAEAIVARFGAAVIGPEGRVDRRALAAIVFSDRKALADQEAIVHPIAIELLDERIARAGAAAASEGREALVCVNAALLYIAPQAARCDAILELHAPLLARLRRARARDGASALAALRRIVRQRRLWRRRASVGRPVVRVYNGGDRAALENALERALKKLNEVAGEANAALIGQF